MTRLRIAILASGGGSNAQAIINACANNAIFGSVEVVISNRSGAGVLQRARAAGIDFHHISSATEGSSDEVDKALAAVLAQHNVNLVVLAGYLKMLGPTVLANWRGSILNIHPALLPKFGGQGMFGRHVHRAVLDAGEKESGATVHLVDEVYDHGAILTQARVPVEPGDDVDTLAARVLNAEHRLYVDTIAAISKGELALPGELGLEGDLR